VGPATVNTVPPPTLEAIRRGFGVRATLAEDVGLARAQLASLEALGISLDAVTDEVLADGVRKFAEPFRQLLATIDERRSHLGAPAAH
jgi:transaldolase